MPYIRRRQVASRRRFTRRLNRLPGYVNSTIVSSTSCIAGNVATIKQYKLNVLLPDVNSGRAVCIRKIVVDAAICGIPTNAGTSASMQCRLAGEPFSEASNIITGGEIATGDSTPQKVIPFGTVRRFVLKPKLSGNINYVFADSTNDCLLVWMSSLLATSAQLAITTYYTYAQDTVISAVA